ncbi:hypothetical protein KZ432_00945 [Glaesserella parasuis]|nr:hypothetical protein [Glaesserella parasuis]MCT8838242.1 hypothetical protein [Glaesserella parasuis]MCT8839942.1 hypothetical protein [Glaesserella parasuis]
MTVIKLPIKRLTELEKRVEELEIHVQNLNTENQLYQSIIASLISLLPNNERKAWIKDFETLYELGLDDVENELPSPQKRNNRSVYLDQLLALLDK